jgi:hypothetical protein
MGVKILDLECLKAAAEALGMEFRENQKTHKAYFQGHCDHAIGIPGSSQAYEVGVKKVKDGEGYSLVADSWGGGNGLIAKVGENAGKLHQEYAVQVAQRALPRGFRATRTMSQDGKVVLRCVR